jgi:hypothetical protein
LQDDDCDGQVDEGFGFGPLGDLWILRRDEFDTGNCTSCGWAWGTALAPTDDGLLALWNLGLSGGEEEPTLYGRHLEPTGTPMGPIELLRQDYILELSPMMALSPLPPKGLPLEAEYRVGSGDVPGLLFVGASGQTDTVMPTPVNGFNGVPGTVWSGERFISAWEDDDELKVAVLGADGSLERYIDVDPLSRPASITFGLFPGRVGILVARYRDDPERRDQWFIQLDARGDILTPAHQIDVEWVTWQRLVGTEQGWLHIRPNAFDEPSTRQPLDPTGEPRGPALPFADGRHLDDSGLQQHFVPRPGLGEMLSTWQDPQGGDMHVEFLDDAGEVLRGWSGPPAPDPESGEAFFVSPHHAFVGERLLIIWHDLAEDAQANRVLVREFGCVP